MKGYEITERGKIAIAVVIAILMIVLAIILALRFLNGSAPPFYNQNQPLEPEQVYTPPEISSTPSPEDIDVNPDETQENGEQGSFDPPQEPVEDPDEDATQEPSEEAEEPEDETDAEDASESGSENGLQTNGEPSLNRSAGTMSFRFSPSSQDSLDDATVAMIGDFLDSPRNTTNTRIVVSMPQLPEVETSKIIAAVTEAFAQKGVAQRDLAFTTYSLSSGNSSYEIRLSFSQATSRK